MQQIAVEQSGGGSEIAANLGSEGATVIGSLLGYSQTLFVCVCTFGSPQEVVELHTSP